VDNPKYVIHLILYINNIGTKKLCEPQICFSSQLSNFKQLCEPQICFSSQLSNFKRSLIELNSLL
jgi:hypothetical protein